MKEFYNQLNEVIEAEEIIRTLMEKEAKTTNKPNTNYCIIDHVGTIEDIEDIKTVYNMAYKLCNTDQDKVYTMKKFCQMLSRNPEAPVSKAQKNSVRFNKHPQEVVLICNKLNTYSKWYANIWAEKVDTLTIIEASTMEVYTMQDLHPDWFSEKYITENTIYRRCAQIWGKALGWSFSAPLYRDNTLNTPEPFIRAKSCTHKIDPYQKQNEEKMRKTFIKNCPKTWTTSEKARAWIIRLAAIRRENWENTEAKKVTSKIASNPDSFLRTRAIASENECKEFFNHYKYLQQNGLLADCLEAGYTLCPDCGRPIYETAEDCDYCNFHRDIEADFETYFEADYYEDWD